jgi:MFS family permease
MKKESTRIKILIALVSISGMSQGMLLPLMAVLLEKEGLPASINGLHASALYIGILLASPLMEAPLKKWGYKPMIAIGGAIVFTSLLLFPLWNSVIFWFVLRLFIGIGDHMLHFSTQTWITSTSTEKNRGKNISLYGLFFGLGFASGPLLTRLVEKNIFLPFLIASFASFLVWIFVFLLKNEFPAEEVTSGTYNNTLSRFKKVWKLSWIALLPPFGYGFLEASINGTYPVYALRQGLSLSQVSILIPAFAVGGIIFQLPLGILSDRIGRQKILKIVMGIGCGSFAIGGFVEYSIPLTMVILFFAGMALGSTFSLGISYMTDLLPKNLLPAGNLLCGMVFSIGSIIGPFLGGITLQLFSGLSYFLFVSLLLGVIFILLLSHKQASRQDSSLSFAKEDINS